MLQSVNYENRILLIVSNFLAEKKRTANVRLTDKQSFSFLFQEWFRTTECIFSVDFDFESIWSYVQSEEEERREEKEEKERKTVQWH